MELGLIGLGRMGASMAQRLIGGGHRVVAYDRSPEAVRAARQTGVVGAGSLQELVSLLRGPRTVWVMVPAGDPTEVAIYCRHPHEERDKRALRRDEEQCGSPPFFSQWNLVAAQGGRVWGLTDSSRLTVGCARLLDRVGKP